MRVRDFVLLFGGMLDVMNPQATETAAERVSRAVREQHERVTARLKSRRR